MRLINNIFLSLLIVCVIYTQTISKAQDAESSMGMDPSVFAVEQLALQVIGAETTCHPDPDRFIQSFPEKKQKDFLDFVRAIPAAVGLLPADIQKLENNLDKLGVSEGVKYYFLYKLLINKDRQLANTFFKKSAENHFPRAVFEWVHLYILYSERSVEQAQTAVRFLQQLKNAQDNEQVQLFLVRLTLQYPKDSMTDMSVEKAIEFVFKNKEYIISLDNNQTQVFLEAAVNYLVLDTDLQNIDGVMPLFTTFVNHQNNDLHSLIKLLYIFQKLNLNQPEFVELCKQTICAIPLCDPIFQRGSSYLKAYHLDTPEILNRINKSADMSKEFLKVALEALEKSMQNKDLDLIEFFFDPKVEKVPDEILPVPVA